MTGGIGRGSVWGRFILNRIIQVGFAFAFAFCQMIGLERVWIEMGQDEERESWTNEYAMVYYLGRCSHVCNGGFITTTAARGKGVGSVMGETYLEYAPKLVSRE